jgi:hypothetical protein
MAEGGGGGAALKSRAARVAELGTLPRTAVCRAAAAADMT